MYLGSLVNVFGLEILSLFRLSHFKAELLKAFDSRQEFTFFIHFITKVDCWEIPDIRLKWYGIEPIEETKARKFDEIYGKDCDCEFYPERNFKCRCAWNKNITLIEQKSFQDLRILSKLGINRSCRSRIDWFFLQIISRVWGSSSKPDSHYYTKT